MHEFAIADQAVTRIAELALQNNAKKIISVEILVGKFSHVGKEQFMFWFREMLNSRLTIARDADIEYKMKEGRDFVLKRVQIEK